MRHIPAQIMNSIPPNISSQIIQTTANIAKITQRNNEIKVTIMLPHYDHHMTVIPSTFC